MHGSEYSHEKIGNHLKTLVYVQYQKVMFFLMLENINPIFSNREMVGLFLSPYL